MRKNIHSIRYAILKPTMGKAKVTVHSSISTAISAADQVPSILRLAGCRCALPYAVLTMNNEYF